MFWSPAVPSSFVLSLAALEYKTSGLCSTQYNKLVISVLKPCEVNCKQTERLMSQIIDSEMNIGNLSLLEKKKKSLSDKNLKMKLTEANLTVCKVH